MVLKGLVLIGVLLIKECKSIVNGLIKTIYAIRQDFKWTSSMKDPYNKIFWPSPYYIDVRRENLHNVVYKVLLEHS